VHLQELKNNPRVELVAFCDIIKNKAKISSKKFGTEKTLVFDNAKTMFKQQTLDAVYFILPPFEHGIEFEAIDRNIPFFIEKPINLYLNQAEEISKEISKKQLLTSVGYMNRYRNGVQKIHKLMENENPLLILGGWVLEAPTNGCEEWQLSKEKCGGQFHEMATHSADLARFLCGEIVEVQAYSYTNQNYNVQELSSRFDSTVVNLKFENGAVGTLWASFAARAGYTETIDLRIYSKNIAGIFEGWGHSLTLMRHGYDLEKIPAEEDVFKKENDAFINAIITGDSKLILSSYSDALKTLRVTLAANESIETNQPISIEY
jgi:predicted dehydrogenase